ncbi:MAG: hypothetical protein F6K58_16570 [Symploca sp. SIO2E9]|nr:hypothetical protein [Symploca sp. SIO2E9]
MSIFITYTLDALVAKKQHRQAAINQQQAPTALKAAIEALRVMEIKIGQDYGINQKEYAETLAQTLLIINQADGNHQALEAVQSAAKGHQLALQFWQCDRTIGYKQMHQCRDKALTSVFGKYPQIKAQALAAVEGENRPSISTGLDKEAVLQAIWNQTSSETSTAIQTISKTTTTQQLSSIFGGNQQRTLYQ